MLTLNPKTLQYEVVCDHCGKRTRPKAFHAAQALREAQKKGWLIKSDTAGIHHFCPECKPDVDQ